MIGKQWLWVMGMALLEGVCAQQAPVVALLERASREYLSAEAFRVDFSYETSFSSDDIIDVWEGTAIIQQNMYHIDMRSTEIYVDGETQWTYLKKENEVMIQGVERGDFADLRSFFDLYIYDDKYLYKLLPLTPDKKWKTIELTPKEADKDLFKIQLRLVEEKIRRVRIYYKDGTRHTYTFQNFRILRLSEAVRFRFPMAKYPDVEVVDLR